MKIKAAVVGYGNLGKYAVQAIKNTQDIECLGVIRRKETAGKEELAPGIFAYDSLESLVDTSGKPDVAILCTPSRLSPAMAVEYMTNGINTVDSFDIHTEIPQVLSTLQSAAEVTGKVAVFAAGWDPGTDSAIRAYLEAMAPVGATFTNFGKGRSMGHSVAAKAVDGIKDAVSITVPMGGGQHSRVVYVLLDNNVSVKEAEERLKQDAYFAHDPLNVIELASKRELDMIADSSHGVLIERTGGSSGTSNQLFKFDMRINNPALTSQVMVSCARATTRLSSGAYTIIDIPPVHLLEGSRVDNIRRLV